MSQPLYVHLSKSALFKGVAEPLLAELEPELELVTLQAGDTLMRQGDPGDAVYTLIEGELDVHIATAAGGSLAVDRIVPTASVGELALLTSRERSATVRAAEASRLVKLSAQAFRRLLGGRPELSEAVVGAVTPRLQRIQLSRVLETWFAAPARELHALQEAVEWVSVAAGQRLYSEGEAADSMYLVMSGRLQLLQRGADGELPLAEVAHGESVGEYAVIGGGKRVYSVVARRDTHLVKLSRDLIAAYPSLLARMAKGVLERSHAPSAKRPDGNGVRTLALVSAGAEPTAKTTAQAVAACLRTALSGWGRLAAMDAATLDEAFGRQGAAQTPLGSPFERVLAHFLNDLELENDYLLFKTDPALSEWTRRCLRQADVVLVIADASAEPEPGPVEREAERLGLERQLVLVHPDKAERPEGTARWLEPRNPLSFHHLRLAKHADAARLGRRITGRANALVFSGGGAKGYAHIGLIRALEEAGVPIDMIAGTSMGALVGGAYALSQDYAFCHDSAVAFGDPRKLLDRTLPLVALNESKAVTKLFQHLFNDVRIEDMWLPFFCVSANLTRAEPVIHETGPLWEAVRASTAIPGIFTPIMHGGDVLVDGGVMNNFPVDLMRGRIKTGTIIGSNAYAQASRDKPYNFGPSISGWQALGQRLLPRKRRKAYPSIVGTLMRATSLSSKYLSEYADSFADVVIRYPTGAYSSLDFGSYDELIRLGYEEAQGALERWRARQATTPAEPSL